MFWSSKKKKDDGETARKDEGHIMPENAAEEKQVTIEAIEDALARTADPDDRIRLLKAAGTAYMEGIVGAPQDLEKAGNYFSEAWKLGDLESRFYRGRVTIMQNDPDNEDEELLFWLGMLDIRESFLQGYEPARDTIQGWCDAGFFPGCRTVADWLEWSDVEVE